MRELRNETVEDEMYLEAYELAKKGEKVLLFCLKIDMNTLTDILASHILEIPMEQFENSEEEVQIRVNTVRLNIDPDCLLVAGMEKFDMPLVERYVEHYAAQGVKNVFLDQVYIRDVSKVDELESKYNVITNYIAVPY